MKYILEEENKNYRQTSCNMAGGGFSGLTSQTFCALSCGSDTPDCIGTARPHSVPRSRTSANLSFCML